MQMELAQISMVDWDVPHNLKTVLRVMDRADVSGGTKLVIFPETTLTGFPTPGNLASIAESVDGPSITAVREAARRKGVAVAVGFSESANGTYHNATVLVDEKGDILLHYRKTHSWASDVGVFTPGDTFAVTEWNGINVGLLICFDIEFPETARAVASLGADLLIVTNGNMDPYGPVHDRAIRARAMENQIFAAMTNRVGAGTGLTFPGESAVIDPFGERVAFGGNAEGVVKAVLDFSKIAESRADYTYLRQARVPLVLRRADKGTTRVLEITGG
ncbi:MAG: carbon-nitrogen hydrolase family protein [Deltaproteobacteria bacterium]|nr:carbon-nitrogen hydrolase family protein [Deltaproteobacteria bacterium]